MQHVWTIKQLSYGFNQNFNFKNFAKLCHYLKNTTILLCLTEDKYLGDICPEHFVTLKKVWYIKCDFDLIFRTNFMGASVTDVHCFQMRQHLNKLEIHRLTDIQTNIQTNIQTDTQPCVLLQPYVESTMVRIVTSHQGGQINHQDNQDSHQVNQEMELSKQEMELFL